MTMTTVRLYGEAGRRFGRVHQVNLDSGSASEAIQYLKANFRGVEAYFMQAKDRGVGFAVFYGKQNINEKELTVPSGAKEIRIAPILMGSKQGGIFQIILGVVLVVVGIIGESPFGQAFGGGVWGSYALEAGIAMLAGGIVQMLTPTPKGLNTNQAAANTPNYAFSGPVNTQAQGNPVPVLYGELIVGSAVISAGIFTDNQVVSSQPATSVANGGMGGGCVAVDAVLPGFKCAADVAVGDELETISVVGFERVRRRVTYAQRKMQPCVRIRTTSGIELDCSTTAPILCADNICRLAPTLLGQLIPVSDFGETRIEMVIEVSQIGDREVMHITCDESVFLAGNVAGRYVGHHNMKAIPGL